MVDPHCSLFTLLIRRVELRFAKRESTSVGGCEQRFPFTVATDGIRMLSFDRWIICIAAYTNLLCKNLDIIESAC
jgi:hypothetical protein